MFCTPVYAKPQQHLSNPTTETTLDNGLKVIIREDHRSPMVMTQIWYAVGSSDEPDNLSGISHALEHMMFKGTTKVPNDEFTRLSRLYGGSVNAATFTNYTNYYQLYQKDYLALALELESDRMSNLVLRQQDFETEMKVVMEERRQRIDDNPRTLAFERFKWIAYPTSHYRQPVIGYMKNLKMLALEHLKKWYQDWYTPNNAILVIVGDVEATATLELVKRYFASIPAQKTPSRNDVLEVTNLGYRQLEVELPVQVPNLYLAWNVHSLATATNPQDAYTLVIIKNILDSGITSRLQNNLVREQKLATSVSVSYDPYNRGDSLFSISALPANDVPLQDIENAILNELEQLKSTPVSTDEINRVITRYVADLIYSQDDIAGQARIIGTLEINGLSHRILDQLPQHYAAVTPEDIQRVANTYFNHNNNSSMYILPEQEK
ncbi:M16 family metallopeptidase [Acinetobacter kanungonis]|uniref:M16 family metallopeptidase n=1 Tax=Acinetobacter kanungonis TaxID=2699469 RepID=UPI00137B08BA|nr:pitrilysin family protein [Acinetobacter kanungonis]NCI79280.1 insulinase family protein [Acinetobacter kanungonis]